MSRTIEQKVVEMRFDNSNFEKNVSQSMISLNRLKETIDKTSSANAFSGLSKALDNVNLGTVTTAIQSVTEKFSLWEEIAIGAARNVGAALSNYVAKSLDNMVFKNIYAGWDKYATKTEAVQTIMASIADQDFGNTDKMEYVEGLMEKLNWFTDETSYHLTDMISAIGKFTSAGVDLDAAADSMMGIANWAAVSGANADTASRVMSQLSQSLGLGAVRVQDWMSVETANMATKEFKELAIAVGKAHGTIDAQGMVHKGKTSEKVAFQNFRQTLQYNWLTSDVLNDTLKQYSGFSNALNRIYDAYGGEVPTSVLIKQFDNVRAKASKTGKTLEEVFKKEYKLDVDFSVYDKEGNVIGNMADDITELGVRAFKAAQEAKTFKEAVDSVGDAASTIWMRVYETIFGNYDEAKELWTGLANDLYELFVEPIWAVSELMDEWRDLGGRDLLFGREEGENGEVVPLGAFDMFMQSIINVRDALDKAFGRKFKIDAQRLLDFTKKVKELAGRFYTWSGDTEKLTKKFETFFGWIKSGIQWFTSIAKKTDIFHKALEDVKRLFDIFKNVVDNTFGDTFNWFGIVYESLKVLHSGVIDFLNSLKLGDDVFASFEEAFRQIAGLAKSVIDQFAPLLKLAKDGLGVFSKVGSFISGNLLKTILKAIADISQFAKEMNLLERAINLVNNVVRVFKDGFNSAFDSNIFGEVKYYLKSLLDAVKTFFDGLQVGEKTFDKIRTIGKGVASAINLLGRGFSFLLRPIKALVDSSFFAEFGKFLSNKVLNAILSIPEAIAKVIRKIDEYLKTHPELMDSWEKTVEVFGHITRFVMDAASAFADFIVKAKPLSKIGNFIKNIFKAFEGSSTINTFGEKVSEAFGKVYEFFRDKFSFEYVKNKFEEIATSFSEFVDNSKFLSSVRDTFSDIWDGISKLFSNDADMSKVSEKIDEIASKIWNFAKESVPVIEEIATDVWDFGKKVWEGISDAAESISEFVENSKLIQDAKKNLSDFFDWLGGKIHEWFGPDEEGNSFFYRVREFFKGLFGSKEADDDLSETEKEARTFGEKVASIFNAIWSALKWAWEKIKFAFNALKAVWDELGIGDWLKSFVKGIGDAFSELIQKLKPAEGDSNKASDGFKKTASVIVELIKGLTKIFTAMAPAFVAGSFVSGLLALASPITAIGQIVNVIIGTFTAYHVAERIKAMGAAISDIIKALGTFVLALAGATVVLAYADSISGGKLDSVYTALASFIAEIVGLLTVLIGVIMNAGVFNYFSGSLAKTGASFKLHQNLMADTVAAIGEVFAEVGKAMLMLAAAAAVLIAIDKVNPGKLWTAFGIIESFLLTLLGLGIAVMVLTEDHRSMGGSITKAGVALSSIGYVEGLYMLGSFMKKIAKSILFIGIAMALVLKASNGDTKNMTIAFAFMEAFLLTMVAGAAVIIGIGNKLSLGGANASIAVKLNGFASFFLSAALAMILISKTAVMLGKEKESDLDKGFNIILKISVILGALAAIGGVAKTGKFAAMGLMMMEAAIALGILALSVKSISKIDETGVQKAIDLIIAAGVIFGILIGIASLTASGPVKLVAFGAMMLEMAGAFAVMGIVLKVLSGIDATQLGSAVGGLVAMTAALVVLFGVVALASSNSIGILLASASLVIMAIALNLVMGAMIAAGAAFSNNQEAFNKAAAALGIVVLAIAALAVIAKLTGPSMLIFGVGLAAVGIGIAAIGAGILLVSLAISAIVATFTLLVKTMLDLGDDFGKALTTFFDGIRESSPSMTKALVAVIDSLTTGIIENLDKIVTIIFNVINGLLKMLAEHLPEMLEYITVIVNAIVDLILNILLNAINTFINGEDGLLPMAYEALFGETGLAAMLNEFINGENGLLAVIDRALFGEHGVLVMFNEFISGENGLLAIVDNALFGEHGLLILFKEFTSGDNGVLGIIDNVLFGEHGILVLFDKFLNGDVGIISIIDTALTTVKDNIDTFITSLLENVRNHATDIVDTVLYLIDEAIRGIIEGTDSVLTGVEELITKIADHIVSLADTIFQAIIDVIDGLATTIETHSGDFWAAVKHLIRAIWNSFWGIFNGGENDDNSIAHLAKNIMSGLGQGIIDFVGEAINGIVNVGSKIVGKFKEVFGIHSPSTVMQGIGEYLDMGLADGITNNLNLPLDSASGLGTTIIEYLRSLLGGSDVSDLGSLLGDTLGGSIEDVLSGLTDGMNIEDLLGGTSIEDALSGITGDIDANSLLDGDIGDSLSSALGGISDSLESDDYTPTITPVLDLSEIQNGADQIPGILGTDSNYGYTVGSSATSAASNASYSPYEYYDGTEKVSAADAQLAYWDALQAKMEEIANKFGRAKVVLDTGAVVGGLLDPMDIALGQKMAQVGRGVYSSTR